MKITYIHIDQKLVEKFRAGNIEAFEMIFHQTKGKLKGFLSKVLPFGEDVESIMQDIYLKIWSKRNFVNPDQNFESYLFAIARNMVVDVMRKRVHKLRYLEEIYCQLKETNGNCQDTLATVEYAELEKRVFELIEKLPEKRRIIFRLNKIDGLTYKEIAKKLNISENTVDTQIRQALSFLRTQMHPYLSLMLWFYLHK